MNTEQGGQFTSFAWTDRLRRSGVLISMDGKDRFLDNIFVERLWRRLKYECVYLHVCEYGSEAKAGVGKWIEFYNRKRPHAALGGRPPAVVYWPRREDTQPDQQERRVAQGSRIIRPNSLSRKTSRLNESPETGQHICNELIFEKAALRRNQTT
ncbi:hypothetical protein POI8812_00212 [Pontivivens insulae]|uniref:Integrase catalytic domain-containing protein n=1 Tax=Pontivivens insulae TaxID=1639689 RepID=A0A2R8A6Q3_9RHOB|nr:hypothetical protein POI8812_00212 [Pontivivens insulae]